MYRRECIKMYRRCVEDEKTKVGKRRKLASTCGAPFGPEGMNE